MPPDQSPSHGKRERLGCDVKGPPFANIELFLMAPEPKAVTCSSLQFHSCTDGRAKKNVQITHGAPQRARPRLGRRDRAAACPWRERH
jgi:hypothetical protein